MTSLQATKTGFAISALAAVVLSTACGGTAQSSAAQGTGGSASGGFTTGGASVGGTSTGGTSTGGASVGGASTGGVSAGGASVGGASTGGGGTQITGACRVDSDCTAVLNAAAVCFSPYCSAPLPASLVDLEQNHCLMLWTEREGQIPTGCEFAGDIACPALCAQPPECVVARCDAGTCALDVGYEPGQCPILGDDCAALNAERRKTLEAAQTCNAAIDIAQCTGSEVVANDCGCDVLVNEAQPERVAAARAARAAWETAGCAAGCPDLPCPPADGGACVPRSAGDFCVSN